MSPAFLTGTGHCYQRYTRRVQLSSLALDTAISGTLDESSFPHWHWPLLSAVHSMSPAFLTGTGHCYQRYTRRVQLSSLALDTAISGTLDESSWARTTVTFPIDDHYNVFVPTLKIYPTIFFLFTANDRPTKTPGV